MAPKTNETHLEPATQMPKTLSEPQKQQKSPEIFPKTVKISYKVPHRAPPSLRLWRDLAALGGSGGDYKKQQKSPEIFPKTVKISYKVPHRAPPSLSLWRDLAALGGSGGDYTFQPKGRDSSGLLYAGHRQGTHRSAP